MKSDLLFRKSILSRTDLSTQFISLLLWLDQGVWRKFGSQLFLSFGSVRLTELLLWHLANRVRSGMKQHRAGSAMSSSFFIASFCGPQMVRFFIGLVSRSGNCRGWNRKLQWEYFFFLSQLSLKRVKQVSGFFVDGVPALSGSERALKKWSVI